MFFTLANGAFKYFINIQKGVLGERMLRRLRFELFARVMRFKPEALKATKSAEIAGMIKDEVEPIGGFFGEAFITPVFLSAQAITALLFILVQDLLLGLLALAIIGIQGLIIPKLRREQLRLGRLRQLESRKLAGRVSEMVDAAPMLRNQGVVPYQAAEIGDRLGLIFGIRFALYRRKFSVKYLNNLLAQVTPFLFYTLGGYLVLNGKLDLGQLIAVITAYRDLPTPIKELIDWDQQRADAIIKFEQVVKAFSPDLLLDDNSMEEPDPLAKPVPIRISSLRYVDRRGSLLLDRISTTIEPAAHLALVGVPASGSTTLAKVLGGQITDFTGTIQLGDRIFGPSAGPAIRYLGSDPFLISGTIRDNIVLGARQGMSPSVDHPCGLSESERSEALRTSNPIYSARQDWIDYKRLGVSGPEELDSAIVTALKSVCGFDGVFDAGLHGPVGDIEDPSISSQLLAARGALQQKLEEAGLTPLVEMFEPKHYNSLATIRENLLFGSPVGPRFSEENLARDPFVRSILAAESLAEPLAAIGIRIAETVLDVLSSIRPGSPLLERYSFVDISDPAALKRDCEEIRTHGFKAASHLARQNITRIGLNYSEPKHRLGLIDRAFEARVIRARISFRMFLSTLAQNDIRFYDRDAIVPTMSIEDNLLFGRITSTVPDAREKVEAMIKIILEESGLDRFVIQQGLDREVGPSGRFLNPEQRATIALARSILMRPETLVLDQALGAFSARDAARIRQSILSDFAGRTLIMTMGEDEPMHGFHRKLVFDGARIIADNRLVGPAQDGKTSTVRAAE